MGITRKTKVVDIAKNSKQMLINYKVKIIIESFPNLEIKTFDYDGSGQNNDIIFINDDMVFRFPKHQKELDSAKKEAEILEFISKDLPLKVPGIKILANKNTGYELGKWFSYYDKIEGVPLKKNDVEFFSNKELLAKQLAEFLKALHGLDVKDLPVSSVGDSEVWLRFYQKVSDKLFQFMNKIAIEDFKYNFQIFNDEIANVALKKTLVHGDFGPTNILYSPSGVTGIIDFGSLHVGDPAVDIASLIGPFGYGEKFIHKMTRFFPEIKSYMNRARFYASTFALQEALFGIENNDAESFEAGIKSYR